jgi:hypothetical protein
MGEGENVACVGDVHKILVRRSEKKRIFSYMDKEEHIKIILKGTMCVDWIHLVQDRD